MHRLKLGGPIRERHQHDNDINSINNITQHNIHAYLHFRLALLVTLQMVRLGFLPKVPTEPVTGSHHLLHHHTYICFTFWVFDVPCLSVLHDMLARPVRYEYSHQVSFFLTSFSHALSFFVSWHARIHTCWLSHLNAFRVDCCRVRVGLGVQQLFFLVV